MTITNASQYKGVRNWCINTGRAAAIRRYKKTPWSAEVYINGSVIMKWFATEREAAIQYDKWVIEHQLDRPLNILKRKAA
jgi:hypothetical protein